MNLVLLQARMTFTPTETSIEWDMMDYLGVCALILVLTFVLVVAGAYARGISPLELLDRLGRVIGVVKKP